MLRNSHKNSEHCWKAYIAEIGSGDADWQMCRMWRKFAIHASFNSETCVEMKVTETDCKKRNRMKVARMVMFRHEDELGSIRAGNLFIGGHGTTRTEPSASFRFPVPQLHPTCARSSSKSQSSVCGPVAWQRVTSTLREASRQLSDRMSRVWTST
jgi:hypothetical protein